MLRTIRDRLSNFHKNHLQGHGHKREETIQREGKEICAIASELGLFKSIDTSIDSLEFNAIGSEHAVAYHDGKSLLKLTLPQTGFGLIPKVTLHRRLDIRSNEETFYKQVEFLGATPLEYLDRWILCNELFNDAVDVQRIIQWADLSISVMISQPYYMGEIISTNEIHQAFRDKSWESIYKDGRAIFYNYAYDAIALDLEPRNCYMAKTGLQPFDLIVSHPDEEMRDYLGI